MKHVGQLIPKELRTDTYREQLKSEQWKDFSNRIRESYHGACAICRRTDVATQVHHKFYEFERNLWEYDASEVILLCTGCHAALHKELMEFRKSVMGLLRPEEFRVLNGALRIALEKYDPLTFVHALAEFVSSPGLVKRYAESFGRPAMRNVAAETYNATERDYDERRK